MAQRYAAAAGLVWTRFEDSDDWIVYNPDSAAVHLMTPAAHRMWAATHEQHASLSDLVLLLAQELGCAQTDPQLLVAADETLRFMDRAGLVVAVTP